MRIARLILGRYGHLSDMELEFPREHGLHIVLGGNEAGKSTALAAMGDCLFGFPHRTHFDFLHRARDLRIGIALRAQDGREDIFYRRKGSKNTLVDAGDQPLPETALAAFLGGATRERFQRVFGLDGAELRSGGATILRGEGEVGESILQAHTGLNGFREQCELLDRQASRLFGDRRGGRELHAAVDAYKAAQGELLRRSVQPTVYKQARDEQDRLEQARAAIAMERQSLAAERSRLDRIRRTTPARKALTRALAECAALGNIPPLPDDAPAQRQAAIAKRDRAADNLARERAQEAALQTKLAALVVDDALLMQAEALDRLAADQSLVFGARRDREALAIVAEQRQSAVEEAGRRLGQTEAAEALRRLIPDLLTRDRATKAIEVHVNLSGRRDEARTAVAAAKARALDEQAVLAALAEPVPAADLRDAIDQVKSEGRIDEDRAAAATALQSAETELAHALAALPLWSGSAEALAAATVPLDAAIAAQTADIGRAEDTERAATAEVVVHAADLRAIDADLGKLAEGGEPPTVEAILAARQRRDRVWRLIRRHRIEGGAEPSIEECADLSAAADLPDLFHRLLHEPDALADGRADDRERAVAFDQLRTRRERSLLAHTVAQAELRIASGARSDVVQAWRDLWRSAGIDPAEPAAMREWLSKRDTVLAIRTRRDAAAQRLASLTARREAAIAALTASLPDRPPTDALAVLQRAAERICRERERQIDAREKARTSMRAAETAVVRAERGLTQIEAQLAAWRIDWDGTAAALGLPSAAPAESGRLALDLWTQIDTEIRAWQDARNRIDQMTAAIDAFIAEAATIVQRVAPDMADVDSHEAIRLLTMHLAAAREAATARKVGSAELGKIRTTIARLAQSEAEAETALSALRRLARAEDDAELDAALARALSHRTLSTTIGEREAELRPLDDGLALADLEAEAGGVDVDALPGRLADIDARLRDLAAEDVDHAGKLADLRTALRAMTEGHDAAGAARDMRNALADIDDISARYVRLRLAQVLLRAGIDRFRREQQGPLLGRAGALFGRLTEGRYDRLGVDDSEDGKPRIVAFRADGVECPAERLSEGTLDQLYLALRLAAIETYASRTEPLPFIADDLLVNFDDRRARAAIRVLAEFGQVTQTILFTHHAHIAEMADAGQCSLHRFPAAASLLPLAAEAQARLSFG